MAAAKSMMPERVGTRKSACPSIQVAKLVTGERMRALPYDCLPKPYPPRSAAYSPSACRIPSPARRLAVLGLSVVDFGGRARARILGNSPMCSTGEDAAALDNDRFGAG